jgi:hypothetical protein
MSRAIDWWFRRKAGTFIWADKLIIYRSFRLSSVRHPEPFNKTQRGEMRRATRKFRCAEKQVRET